jgi:hypothetical protein
VHLLLGATAVTGAIAAAVYIRREVAAGRTP